MKNIKKENINKKDELKTSENKDQFKNNLKRIFGRKDSKIELFLEANLETILLGSLILASVAAVITGRRDLPEDHVIKEGTILENTQKILNIDMNNDGVFSKKDGDISYRYCTIIDRAPETLSSKDFKILKSFKKDDKITIDINPKLQEIGISIGFKDIKSVTRGDKKIYESINQNSENQR